MDFLKSRVYCINVVVTCFHEFRIYDSTNVSLFSFKNRKKNSIEIINVGKTVNFHKIKHFEALLKENKTFFMKKFVDS